jgi:hypothetical protein
MDNCVVQELIKFDPSKETASFGKQLVIAMLCVIVNNVIFNVIIRYLPQEHMEDYDEEVDDEFENIQEKQISPVLFGISEMLNGGIYAPIVEELFFRFLLFKIIFVKIFRIQPTSANILQAVIFGLMHLSNVVSSDQQFKKTCLQTLSATIGGLISGWSYMYTNSILTPLMSHMINNIISTSADTIEYSEYVTKNPSD